MPVTNYTTVNGMLIGERTDSAPRIDYVPDALGSIVAAVDQNLNTTYTAAYKPYGDVLASTGTAPRFTWVGAAGYFASAGVTYAEYSVRARIVSSKNGRWTSIDSLWPSERPFAYVSGTPTTSIDPSGNEQALCQVFTQQCITATATYQDKFGRQRNCQTYHVRTPAIPMNNDCVVCGETFSRLCTGSLQVLIEANQSGTPGDYSFNMDCSITPQTTCLDSPTWANYVYTPGSAFWASGDIAGGFADYFINQAYHCPSYVPNDWLAHSISCTDATLNRQITSDNYQVVLLISTSYVQCSSASIVNYDFAKNIYSPKNSKFGLGSC